MKKFLFPIAGAIIAFVLSSAIPTEEAQAAPGDNCPLDWHPPPCGIPPKPVKSWIQEQIEGLEQYHFSASQVFGVAVAATCFGSTGEPRVDQVRKTVCAMGSALGAIAVGMQVWEKRLIEQLNAARDGGTQEVVMMPPDMASFQFDTEGDPFLEALADHHATIEWLGGMIVDSVHTTFLCDAWAQYDIDGITCGNNQRAWTDALLDWQGQRYSAVSAIEDVFVYLLDADVAGDFVNTVDYDAQVNGWEGWEFQQ